MTVYLTYDVFTDRPFGGNPLAILPDAGGIAAPHLAAIAREFNYSETVFVLPPRDPGHLAYLRIFTPGGEVPFAGHPLIGTCIALADRGAPADFVLEVGTGPIACKVSGGTASFTTTTPLWRGDRPDVALVGACLSLPVAAIRIDRHAPAIAGLGLPFVLAELADAEALTAARPDISQLRRAAQVHPLPMDFAIFAYTRDGDRIEARMFAPLDGIPEDPATGSACATLGALLHDLDGTASLDISQGVAMGRPSRIGVAIDAGGVTVAGQAVAMMSGTLRDLA